jgi:hypothetical protein
MSEKKSGLITGEKKYCHSRRITGDKETHLIKIKVLIQPGR